MAHNNLHIALSREEDIPEIMRVRIPAFAHIPVETMQGNVDTPEAREAAGQRHLRAWREHREETGRPCDIKCVRTDPESGEETIVAGAEWFIYDRSRSEEKTRRQNYLLSSDWVSPEDGRQEKARSWMKPIIDGRVKWTAGRAHGMFMYMATDPAWRRQGAATMCVQWGLDECGKSGVPAYLEATDEGEKVYRKLGFELVERIVLDVEGVEASFPAMMWWPPGTRDEDKRPLVQ